MAGAQVTKSSPAGRRAVSRLARAQARLERERQAVVAMATRASSVDLGRRPRPGTWSGIEILAHLVLVEQSVVRLLAPESADRPVRLVGGPLPALLRRLPCRLRLLLLERRLGRAAAPALVRPADVPERDEVLRRLEAARAATRMALDADDPLRLAGLRRTHAVLGAMDGLEWLEFIAAHDRRHAGQLRAALASAPGAAPRTPS